MPRKKDKPKKLDDIKLFEPEKENLDFPSLCKFIRQTLDVTQEEMAQRLNITKKAYSYWEHGKRVPKSWQALNLALIYLYAKEQAAKKEVLDQELLQNANSQQLLEIKSSDVSN